VTSLLAYSVWLSLVLGHTGVDGPEVQLATFSSSSFAQSRGFVLDNVWANWCPEDIWQRVSGIAGLAIGRDDGDGWSGSHFAGDSRLSNVVVQVVSKS